MNSFERVPGRAPKRTACSIQCHAGRWLYNPRRPIASVCPRRPAACPESAVRRGFASGLPRRPTSNLPAHYLHRLLDPPHDVLAHVINHAHFQIAAFEQRRLPVRRGSNRPPGSRPCIIRLARELSTSFWGADRIGERVKNQRGKCRVRGCRRRSRTIRLQWGLS